MKLHLGCGKKKLDGFINIDIERTEACDIVDNVFILSTIEDNSVDLIYASHVLEHASRHDIQNILKIWNKKLKVGATLRLSVPSFEKVAEAYSKGFPMEKVLGFLVGGQKNENDYHKVVFDLPSLKKNLENSYFCNIRHYDWKKTEHSHVDDYSQAYLPHMEKSTGLLMSLNIEADKKLVMCK